MTLSVVFYQNLLRKDLCQKEGRYPQSKQRRVLSVPSLYCAVSVNIYTSVRALTRWLIDSILCSPAQTKVLVWTLIRALASPVLPSPSTGFISLPLRVSLVITQQAQGTEELRKHTHTHHYWWLDWLQGQNWNEVIMWPVGLIEINCSGDDTST